VRRYPGNGDQCRIQKHVALVCATSIGHVGIVAALAFKAFAAESSESIQPIVARKCGDDASANVAHIFSVASRRVFANSPYESTSRPCRAGLAAADIRTHISREITECSSVCSLAALFTMKQGSTLLDHSVCAWLRFQWVSRTPPGVFATSLLSFNRLY
jgi:hypothetical protein